MSVARRPLLAFAGFALLPVARYAAGAETLVKGSGVASTQRRDVGTFVGVGLAAPFAVVLRAASREAIEIVADDNILPLVQTQLKGSGNERSLQIDLPRDTRVEPRTPIVITVDYVRLQDLAIGGSGKIDLAGLDAERLSVAIGGSGTFRADGRARTLSVSIGGSGRCDAERLVAADVSVSIGGSGDARVRAETALSASIAGSGDLYHAGAAVPQAAIVGSGRIKRI